MALTWKLSTEDDPGVLRCEPEVLSFGQEGQPPVPHAKEDCMLPKTPYGTEEGEELFDTQSYAYWKALTSGPVAVHTVASRLGTRGATKEDMDRTSAVARIRPPRDFLREGRGGTGGGDEEWARIWNGKIVAQQKCAKLCLGT